MSKHDTTENWNNAIGFVPLPGEIIIYDDYQEKTYTVVEDGVEVTKTKKIPGVKIGSGNAAVQDLAFVDEDLREMILNHIRDQEIHVTLGEKAFWNNKINVDDSEDIMYGTLEDETLILNRN
jgi:hypothetical protein